MLPWVTLGLVLDDKGFPLGSQGFPGNASEPATLPLMLDGKNPLPGEKPVIIMDAGIASADNIAWLTGRGYLYRVVSRERDVQAPQNKVTVYRALEAETGETRLYCHSGQKDKNEQAIRNRFPVRLEEALDKLNAGGLDKKGTIKNYAKILERIGRLREKTAASHQTTVSRSLPMMKKQRHPY